MYLDEWNQVAISCLHSWFALDFGPMAAIYRPYPAIAQFNRNVSYQIHNYGLECSRPGMGVLFLRHLSLFIRYQHHRHGGHWGDIVSLEVNFLWRN